MFDLVYPEVFDLDGGEGADLERGREVVRIGVLQVHLGVLGVAVQSLLFELGLEGLLQIVHLPVEHGGFFQIQSKGLILVTSVVNVIRLSISPMLYPWQKQFQAKFINLIKQFKLFQ